MPIDRSPEDDTPRATPESRPADAQPPAEQETPDRVACAIKYRETVDAVNREYQAAREWDEAVPALREAWENHEKDGHIQNGPRRLPFRKLQAPGVEKAAATSPPKRTPKSPAAANESARSAKPSSPQRCAA